MAQGTGAPGTAGVYSAIGRGSRVSVASLGLSYGEYDLEVYAENAHGRSAPLVAKVSMLAGSSMLRAIRPQPNPWRADRRHPAYIDFPGAPAGTNLKIFTVAGHLVRRLSVADGGTIRWDLRNESGQRAASGLYLFLLSHPDADSARGKLAVIR
jgi:hypothetical protein